MSTLARLVRALHCWLVGHEGLGIRCHRCGVLVQIVRRR